MQMLTYARLSCHHRLRSQFVLSLYSVFAFVAIRLCQPIKRKPTQVTNARICFTICLLLFGQSLVMLIWCSLVLARARRTWLSFGLTNCVLWWGSLFAPTTIQTLGPLLFSRVYLTFDKWDLLVFTLDTLSLALYLHWLVTNLLPLIFFRLSKSLHSPSDSNSTRHQSWNLIYRSNLTSKLWT